MRSREREPGEALQVLAAVWWPRINLIYYGSESAPQCGSRSLLDGTYDSLPIWERKLGISILRNAEKGYFSP